MAIEVLFEKYEVEKYQDEQWKTSSSSYNKLPIGFDSHCSFDEFSKIKPLRYLHMGHMKINRSLFMDGKQIGKVRCNVGLMDKYQYY